MMMMMMMTVTRLVIQDYYLHHHHFTLIFFDVGTYDLLLKLHCQKKLFLIPINIAIATHFSVFAVAVICNNLTFSSLVVVIAVDGWPIEIHSRYYLLILIFWFDWEKFFPQLNQNIKQIKKFKQLDPKKGSPKAKNCVCV